MSKSAATQSKIMPRRKVWKDDAPSVAPVAEIPERAKKRVGLKSKGLQSSPLRDSARGEQCTLVIAGVCNQNSETVVLCHLPFLVGAGMAQKAPDFCACYGCSACHDAIDGRSIVLPLHERLFYATRALVRTLARMVEKGLVKIKGVSP